MASIYEKRGVSSAKEDVHKAIQNLDKGLVAGSFCKVIPDFLANDSEYALLMHADGAGTKSALAYAYWKETGNLDVWRDLAQDALIMNIDDMLCAGAIENFIISSTIGRNKKLIPGEVISEIIRGFEECIEFLNSYGLRAVSSGGETADVGDLVRTIIVDSTVVSRLRRQDIISNHSIQDGDVIIGLSSAGQASYEKKFNSGIGSNGLTSARHDIFSSELKKKYPETFDNSTDDSLVYCGKYELTSPSPIEGIDMGRFVLSPTRTYAPVVREIFSGFKSEIHGMIHCTGGGQTKVLNYIRNLHIVKNNLLPVPDIFKIIQSASQAELKEMYEVYNMGHRLELYVPERIAQDILNICNAYNIDSQIIGFCSTCEKRKLTIATESGQWCWEKD